MRPSAGIVTHASKHTRPPPPPSSRLPTLWLAAVPDTTTEDPAEHHHDPFSLVCAQHGLQGYGLASRSSDGSEGTSSHGFSVEARLKAPNPTVIARLHFIFIKNNMYTRTNVHTHTYTQGILKTLYYIVFIYLRQGGICDRQGLFVCLSLCLSVCQQHNSKSFLRILMKL